VTQVLGYKRVSLLRSMIWFVGPYGFAIAGYLLMSVAAARFLGREDLASFLVVLTVAGLLGQVGLVGVHRSGLREAASLEQGDEQALGRLRGGVLAVCLTVLPLVSLITGVTTFALTMGRGQLEATGLGVTITCLTYLSGQQKLLASYLRGLGHARAAGLLEGRSGGALVACGQALLVVLVWRLWPETGLVGALVGATVGFVPPVVASWFLLAREWRGVASPPGALRNLRVVIARDWKFAVSQVGGYANASLDLWICTLLLPATTASLFAAGQRFAQLLLVPMTAMQVVFSPAIARMAAGDRGRLQRLVRTGSSMGTLLVGIAWLPIVIAPAFVLELVFGAEFRDAATVLVLLSTAYLTNAVSGMSGITLSMSHHEGYVARVQWIALVLRLILGAAAALWLGLIGIAVTSAVVTCLFYVLMWLHARSHVGVVTHATLRPDVRLLVKVAG
jgi:O-antigen/teichoic acid export membrane protein